MSAPYYMTNRVKDVRNTFKALLNEERFVIDKTGCKMIELVGATFFADEPAIFGKPNDEWHQRELAWYDSMSLNINDIPGGAPEAWKASADNDGWVNSNYGFLMYHSDNYNQFANVVRELEKNPFSRRAVAIYTRPKIWYEYNLNGKSDFICTNAVQYMIRDGLLVAVVQMRSNDGWSGYRGDHFWQKTMQDRIASKLGVQSGDLIWHAGSLHFYQKDFYLIHHSNMTGEISIPKKKYQELYPDSPWA